MFKRMKVEKEEGRGRESIFGETQRVTKRERLTIADPTATATATTTTTTTGEAPPVTESTRQVPVQSKLSRLTERLKKLNSYSSILNILTLMSLS